MDYGIKHFGCEKDYYILSGKHHLLFQSDIIAYYNCYLGNFTVADKLKWACEVYEHLRKKFRDLNDICFVIFAGENYHKYLKAKLPHYITLQFDGRKITFDIKEKK